MVDIVVRNTSATITYTSQREKVAIHGYLDKNYSLYDWARKKKGKPPELKAAYWAGYDNIYICHINALDGLLLHLRNNTIISEDFTVRRDIPPKGLKIDVEMTSDITLREYQRPAWKFMTSCLSANEYKGNLLGLPPGYGKTLMFILRMCEIKQRTCMIMRPGYIQQWKNELIKHTTLIEEDIFHVKGGPSLHKLTSLSEGELSNIKIIAISNKTYLFYLKAFIKSRSSSDKFNHPVTPDKLMSHLKIGTILVDEAHEDLHLNVLIQLFSNVEDFFGLSGTMISLDPFIDKIQKMMYPMTNRYDALFSNPYIHYVLHEFSTRPASGIRTQFYGNKAYSHTAYEKSIMKNGRLRRDYFELITTGLKYTFFKRKRGIDDKCLVFFATIDMINAFNSYLEHSLGEQGIGIIAFIAGSDYEDIINCTVASSTLTKAGTALDIPNLITVYNTVNVMSPQRNIQSVARLRDLKGKEMICVQMINLTIPKHRAYQVTRDRFLGGMFKTRLKITNADPL